MEGSRPVKTGPPQQVWMYAESSTGMENQELLLNDLPRLRPALNFPILRGSAWAVPARPRLGGPAAAWPEVPGERVWGMLAGWCPGAASLGRDLR